MAKKKCPYNVKDCEPDEACKLCRGLVKCPICNEQKLIPIHRDICYECSMKNKLPKDDDIRLNDIDCCDLDERDEWLNEVLEKGGFWHNGKYYKVSKG